MDIARLIATRDPSDIVTCPASASVRDAVKLLAERRIGAMPVLRQGQLTGIFSERDVLYRLAEEGAFCLEREVGEVMTSPPVTIARETSADEALELMTRRRIRHLPVMDGPLMVGFISIGDIVKGKIDAVTAEAIEVHPANAQLPILVCHGTSDDVLPLAMAMNSKRHLEKLNLAPEFHTYPMPHSVCAEEVADISAFIQKHL